MRPVSVLNINSRRDVVGIVSETLAKDNRVNDLIPLRLNSESRLICPDRSSCHRDPR